MQCQILANWDKPEFKKHDQNFWCHLELGSNTLMIKNRKHLQLSLAANRFSELTENYEKHPDVYFNETQLKKKITKVSNILKY